jgi:hypothetical protein
LWHFRSLKNDCTIEQHLSSRTNERKGNLNRKNKKAKTIDNLFLLANPSDCFNVFFRSTFRSVLQQSEEEDEDEDLKRSLLWEKQLQVSQARTHAAFLVAVVVVAKRGEHEFCCVMTKIEMKTDRRRNGDRSRNRKET